MSADDKTRGIYPKYIIFKANGEPCDPEACYLVLRLDTDLSARTAARAFAASASNRVLAECIDRCLDELRDGGCGCRSVGECNHTSAIWRYGDAMALQPPLDVKTALQALAREFEKKTQEDSEIFGILFQHVQDGSRYIVKVEKER